MALNTDQIVELKAYYPELKSMVDGGIEFILMSPFALPPGCTPGSVDALLCPSGRDGYTSRLFLSEKITHKGSGQNWNPQNATMIGGRPWWAVSWRTNQEDLSLLGMVLAHLRAFT